MLVGHYKIIRKIAEGELGGVFEAIDVTRNRRAALKCLRPEVTKRPEVVQLLHTEAQTLALLDHPNIARVFGCIYEGSGLYLAMEFIEGETLQSMLERGGRLEQATALSLFQQILSAVGFAHSIGVLHRDLRPSNVMVTNSGAAKVINFGITHILGRPRTTRAGYIVGTTQYLSPEQIRGEPVDGRSDVYSLGILLYELLVGRAPFDGDSDYEVLRAQVEDAPPPPRAFLSDIPEWLEGFLLRALAKSPSNRFRSVMDMSRVVGRAVKAKNRSPWAQDAAVRLARRWTASALHLAMIMKTRRFGWSWLKQAIAETEIAWKRHASIGLLLSFAAVQTLFVAGDGMQPTHDDRRSSETMLAPTTAKPARQAPGDPINVSLAEPR